MTVHVGSSLLLYLSLYQIKNEKSASDRRHGDETYVHVPSFRISILDAAWYHLHSTPNCALDIRAYHIVSAALDLPLSGDR